MMRVEPIGSETNSRPGKRVEPGHTSDWRQRDAVAALTLEIVILTAARSGEVIAACDLLNGNVFSD